MQSNGWKLALAAPLLITLMTACGKKKKDGVANSAYAGTWVDYNAVEAFQSSPANFCAFIQAQPTPLAFTVEPNGNVIEYSPYLEGADARERSAYHWGKVHGDRFRSVVYEKRGSIGFNPMMYSQQAQRIRVSENTRFTRRENLLTLWERGGEHYLTLVARTQAEQLMQAANACLGGRSRIGVGPALLPQQPMVVPPQPMMPPPQMPPPQVGQPPMDQPPIAAPGYGPEQGPPPARGQAGPPQTGWSQGQKWDESQPPFDDEDPEWKAQQQRESK